MASILYKRYVPPKKVSDRVSTASPAQNDNQNDSSNEGKRKREHTKEDYDAQKLKKTKHAKDSLIESHTHEADNDEVTVPVWHKEPGYNGNSDAGNGNGIEKADFSHIKNTKKRHKLEKEARKQRKNLEKQKSEDSPVTSSLESGALVQQEEGIASDQNVEQDPAENGVPEAIESTDDDNEHLRKHTSVMSKFQKAVQHPKVEGSTLDKEDSTRPKPELRDLGPLPQPEPVEQEPFKADPSLLPSWLLRPEKISSKPSLKTFDMLGLEPKLVRHLNALTFINPLPVQEAMIPLLMPPTTERKSRNIASRFLPGSEPVLPDIAVSAPTGSGKTLAYLLPIIESLKQTSPFRKLKAIVIVPTRDLVQQVRAVAEVLAKGSNIQIGAAVNDGKTKFSDEQSKLVAKRKCRDQEQYDSIMHKQHLRNYPPMDLHDTSDLEALLPLSTTEEQRIEDIMSLPPGFVTTYTPTVDLLIATPGRLLEHINNTLGFSLDNLDWLVLDEADKLLEQQYDGFLERVNTLLPSGTFTKRGCRKVMLSATMTRDVSKLSALRLRWPMLVIVGDEEERILSGNVEEVEPDFEGRFALPPTLQEFCIPVSDASEKPLLLLRVLESNMLTANSNKTSVKKFDSALEDAKSASSVTSSDSDDASSLSSSSISSDSSDDSSDSDDSSSDEESISSASTQSPAVSSDHQSLPAGSLTPPSAPTLLIFTSSTTSAARLSYLLRSLRPSLASSIISITKSQRLPSQKPSPKSPIIAITTDRTSRGLDTILSRPVTHVIQYDVPRSLRDYVHRAGRSARAGRLGENWSFYENHQARWFVKEVLKSEKVNRKVEVEKLRVVIGGDNKADEDRRKFVDAVEAMRGLVFGKDSK